VTELTTRTDSGQFAKGVSGNPAGRPKGRKNEIVELRQKLELAVREHLKPEKIVKIVDKLATMAENGNVAAAKLLLDKVVPNARADEDDDGNNRGGIEIRIVNATFGKTRELSVIEAEPAVFTEVKK
jgi:hypothetical protein